MTAPYRHLALHRDDVPEWAREDSLTAAGWKRSSRLGWWIDPASGEAMPVWRALGLARRDAPERGDP